MISIYLNRLNKVLTKLTLSLACIALILMALHVTLDVVLRNIFGASPQGALEIVSFYYMVMVVFLPLAFVESIDEHIKVDVIIKRLPIWLQRYFYIFSCVISFIFFLILSWQSFEDALRATMSLETTMANFTFYIWPSRWFLSVGFTAICFSILNNIVNVITKAEDQFR